MNSRGRVQPRKEKPNIGHVPTDEAKKIFDDFVAETRRRQLSSSENYDKSILTYSSGGLAVSLAFLKDFIPTDEAENLWMLYGSWGLFLTSIILTVGSFLASYKALDKMQAIAERYYIEGDREAINEEPAVQRWVNISNIICGFTFSVALLFSTLFVSTNLQKAAEMKKNRTLGQDGILAPQMQKRGVPSPALPKAPSSPAPSPAPTTQQPAKPK